MTADADESVRCSLSGCSCLSFKPGSAELRSCDVCRHSWVLHAVQRLRPWPPVGCGAAAEAALPGSVFRLSSLVLYGARAVPVRLKILLDRLYSVLSAEQVRRILHSLGWTLADYIRGYMLQAEGEGAGPERWPMATPEEEQLVLRQFLRFGETRSIVQLMAPEISSAPTDGQGGGQKGALLLPLHFPSSAFFCFAQPSKESAPPAWGRGREAPPSRLSKCGAAPGVETEPKVARPWPPPQGPGPQRGVAGLRSPSPFLPSVIFNSASSLSVNPPELQSPSPSSSAGRKGRVFCGVCGKSFYDKGTLKIHYNAVHLQIKHRCTVSGCSMVFSSLRSRNRHSANPNPRLHTHTQSAWLPQPQPQAQPPPPAATQVAPAVSGAKRGRATPPPPPLPAKSGRRQLVPAATRLWESCGMAPKKKKPRKSSMPLKLEREEEEEEEE